MRERLGRQARAFALSRQWPRALEILYDTYRDEVTRREAPQAQAAVVRRIA
jgi:hypothetical protein